MDYTYRIAGNFRGVQFSRKGNLQRFHGLIFADGHSITAPPTIPGWLCLLPHVQLQRTYATFLQSKLLSIKAHRCSHSILSSVFSYLKSGENFSQGPLFRRSELSSVSITCFTSALADSMDDDGPVVDRATWIMKLGSVARRLKIP